MRSLETSYPMAIALPIGGPLRREHPHGETFRIYCRIL
jgi:hypothetical protein